MIRFIVMALAVGLALLAVASLPARADTPNEFRWDLVNVSIVNGKLVVKAGGADIAKAPSGATASLTGTGEFEVGEDNEAGGSGTFVLKDASGGVTASGTYEVTGFASWMLAPGSLALLPIPVVDKIGEVDETHAGVLMLTIHLNGVGDATLGIDCHLPGTPDSLGIEEGITLVLGGTSYTQSQGFTLFHEE